MSAIAKSSRKQKVKKLFDNSADADTVSKAVAPSVPSDKMPLSQPNNTATVPVAWVKVCPAPVSVVAKTNRSFAASYVTAIPSPDTVLVNCVATACNESADDKFIAVYSFAAPFTDTFNVPAVSACNCDNVAALRPPINCAAVASLA